MVTLRMRYDAWRAGQGGSRARRTPLDPDESEEEGRLEGVATPPDIRGVLWFLPIQEYLLERVEEFPRVHRLLERRTRSVVPGDAELRGGDSGDRDDGGGRVLLAQRLDNAAQSPSGRGSQDI